MLDAFGQKGRWGLQQELYEEASRRWQEFTSDKKPEDREKNSWFSLVKDHNEITGYVYQFLMLLPDCIIRSLIRNTLTYDYYHSGEVRSFADTYMMPKQCAGIYIHISSLRPRCFGNRGPSDEDHAGKWLTSDSPEDEDEDENAKIDNFFWRGEESERRYMPGKEIRV